jgi:hypothetical protein
MNHAVSISLKVSTFACLITDPVHTCAVTIMNNLPPIAEIATTARDVQFHLESESVRGRLAYLFEKFCAMKLFSEIKVGWTTEVWPPTDLRVVLTLTPIGSQFLSDFATAGEETQVVTQVLRPDREEQEILNLLQSVGHRLTTTQILQEFNRRNNPKADSTTKAKLSSLVKKGLLTTRRSPKPSGYALPEW